MILGPNGESVFLTAGGTLLGCDMISGEIVWCQKTPKPGVKIVIPPDGECLLVGRPHLSCGSDYLLKMTFDGRVLERWPDSPYQAIDFAEEECRAGRLREAERWLRVAAESDIPPYFRARAYRALGELAETGGRIMEALDRYERAIALDPKVGVKKKISAMRKASRQGGENA